MAGTADPQPPAEPPEPGAAAAAKDAAEQAAAEGASKPQARAEAAEAAREADPGLSEADARRIAGFQVDEMERRGLFDHPAPPPAAPAHVAEPGAAEPIETPAEPPPRKRTFAERFVGRRG